MLTILLNVCVCVTHLGVNPYSTDGADLKIVSCRDMRDEMSHVISVQFNMHHHISQLISSHYRQIFLHFNSSPLNEQCVSPLLAHAIHCSGVTS